MPEAQHFLFETVPGLYEHGATMETIHRLFLRPNKARRAARGYIPQSHQRESRHQDQQLEEAGSCRPLWQGCSESSQRGISVV